LAQELIVAGPHACFVRPEFVDNVVTYDVMTPLAARGLFESIHWTPAIKWNIETITVLNPIKKEWITPRRATVPSGEGETKQWLALVDVRYHLRATFELTPAAGPRDNAAQHSAMFRRRLSNQRFFRTPFLGHPSLPATVEPFDRAGAQPSSLAGTGAIDLGWMIYDLDPASPDRRRYYRPLMREGIIDLTLVNPSSLPS
jgi:CRISPR-associated protein Cas5d